MSFGIEGSIHMLLYIITILKRWQCAWNHESWHSNGGYCVKCDNIWLD